jgi:hypothetical protein
MMGWPWPVVYCGAKLVRAAALETGEGGLAVESQYIVSVSSCYMEFSTFLFYSSVHFCSKNKFW